MCVCVCVGCACVCVDVFPISPGHPYPTLSQNPPLTHLKQSTSQLFDSKTYKEEEEEKLFNHVKVIMCCCDFTAGHTCRGILLPAEQERPAP